VLQCGHTLCLECTTKCFNEWQKRIKCPNDNKIHKVIGGIDNLPKNYALINVLEEKIKAQ
jgi:hypothetical protein